MAINCETKKRIIAYFTSIICGPFANDYSLLAYGDCRVWWAKVNEECKDLSGQHLLSVMASMPCIKCLALLLSLYPVFCIWLLVKNVFGEIYCTEFILSHWTTFKEKVLLSCAGILLACRYSHVYHGDGIENQTEISQRAFQCFCQEVFNLLDEALVMGHLSQHAMH